MAYRYEGFWRAMDTLRDRQMLEEMVERGDMPWRARLREQPRKACGMKAFQLAGRANRLSVLCLGAHSDDIEIGAGGTLLSLTRGPAARRHWCVLSGGRGRARARPALRPAISWRAPRVRASRSSLPRRLLPGAAGTEIKSGSRRSRTGTNPDVILTHAETMRIRTIASSQPAHLEHVPRPTDPRIRDPQVGRRPRPDPTSTCLSARHDGAQESSY